MNKKIISSAFILTCFCLQPLSALSKLDQKQQAETEVLEGKQTATPLQEIGLEEAPVNEPRSDSSLRNWWFAAGSIVSATVAILVVGWSQGAAPNSN